MSKRVWYLLVVVVLLAGMLGACGASEPTAEPEPAVPENAALKITGNVNQEMGWTEEEVRAMNTMDAVSTNSKGESETYTGVSLNTLLEMAGPASDATTVTFVADDGYTAEMALDELKGCADCIASFRNQGGFSVVAPGFPGSTQVKGVVEIQVQ
jgi:DMSO/TMAO reductase YedYZ molybdopterin-dependent catalytic subunit